jgi:hypothetical protein
LTIVMSDHVSFIFVFFCVFCCRWRAFFGVFCYKHQHGNLFLLLCVFMCMMNFFFVVNVDQVSFLFLFLLFIFYYFYSSFDFFRPIFFSLYFLSFLFFGSKLRINLEKERYFFPFHSFFSFMCSWE